MDKNKIGTMAGLVWQALNKNGKLTAEQLQQDTMLDGVSVAMAIGWLAREDKINFEEQNGVAFFYLFKEVYY